MSFLTKSFMKNSPTTDPKSPAKIENQLSIDILHISFHRDWKTSHEYYL